VEILQGHRSRDAGTVPVLASADRRRRSHVGVVRQDESALAELTVRETVAPFALSCPRPRDVPDVVATVGLEQYAEIRIKRTPGSKRPPAVGGAARTRHSV
jgi:ABC-2 type transport system ATP-binding protein